MKVLMSLVSDDSNFQELLDEVGRDPRVGKLLPNVSPVATRRNGDSSRLPSKSANDAATVYRDPADVRTIFSLTRLLTVLSVIIVASAAANIFQFVRRPDRIVVDGSSGRVLSINDRNYGKEERVEFGPDKLTTEDKLYVTKEFARYLYQVDPATRPRDMEKALRMMVPSAAVQFANWLKQTGILNQQRDESWQAVWTPMEVTVDPSNAYTVNVIGRQEINKLVNGALMKDAKQMRVTIKLMADPTGRADRNLRSGFLISYIDAHELNDTPSTSASSSAAPREGEASKPVTPVSALKDSQ